MQVADYEPHNVLVTESQFQGQDAISISARPDLPPPNQPGGCDNCTFARLTGSSFSLGSIEIQVVGKPIPNAPPFARGFVGIVFNISEDHSSYEGFYLRPLNAISDNEEQRNRSVQYFAAPDYPWHRLRGEHPDVYESWADVRPGEWTQLKVELTAERARLYVDGAQEPVLDVERLLPLKEGDAFIGLYTEPATET